MGDGSGGGGSSSSSSVAESIASRSKYNTLQPLCSLDVNAKCTSSNLEITDHLNKRSIRCLTKLLDLPFHSTKYIQSRVYELKDAGEKRENCKSERL